MHRPYLKPQEYGSHWDCSWCEISGEEMSFQASSKEGFMFQACEYTQEELSEKAHDFELKEAGCTVLCLDHNQSGIGSGSCGPQLLEKYQFNEPEFPEPGLSFRESPKNKQERKQKMKQTSGLHFYALLF